MLTAGQVKWRQELRALPGYNGEPFYKAVSALQRSLQAVSEERNQMRVNPKGLRLCWDAATLLVPCALAAQSITISPSYAAIGVKQTQQ
jgi:hypothetical protein